MTGSVSLGLLLALAGCLSLYLASPNQRWRAAPLPARPARGAAALLLPAALFLLLLQMQVAAAAFTLSVWVMLLLVALPYGGALVKRSR